jgi:mono/diheme cytochrome c family protein
MSEATVCALRTWPAVAAVALVLALAGCGGGGKSASSGSPSDSGPARVDATAPGGLSEDDKRGFETGKALTEASGCLACHQIGRSGSGGPGPDLSSLGARRTDAEIVAVLRGDLHAQYLGPVGKQLDKLVLFLAELRRPPSRRNPSTGATPLGVGMLSRCC